MDRFPTSSEIADRLREFAADPRFAAIARVADLPNATGEGRVANAITIGTTTGGPKPVAVITGGVHAREWAPPLAIVNLIQAILEAYVANTPVTMASAVRAAETVKAIVETVTLVIAPMINPDGYEFSLAHDSSTPALGRGSRGWRKNRRPAPATLPSGCTAANAIGVDINRNFDVLWDFEQFYTADGIVQSSKNPCSVAFIGSAAFSEPESQNVKALLDANEPRLFIDVHMFGPDILFSWGVEQNAPIAGPTPVLNTGRVRDGTIPPGDPGFNGYMEPINETFLDDITQLAKLMADAAQTATGTHYEPVPGAKLISISGAADDFAFSRNLGTARAPIQAFTIECGASFLPTFDTEFPAIQAEVQAALMAAVSTLATTTTSAPPPAPAPPTPPAAPPPPSSCRC